MSMLAMHGQIDCTCRHPGQPDPLACERSHSLMG